jgi:hypothetical protein
MAEGSSARGPRPVKEERLKFPLGEYPTTRLLAPTGPHQKLDGTPVDDGAMYSEQE